MRFTSVENLKEKTKKAALEFDLWLECVKKVKLILNLRETVALVAFQAPYFIGQITKTVDQERVFSFEALLFLSGVTLLMNRTG